MTHLAVPLLAAAWVLASTTLLAQESPRFELGFDPCPSLIADLVTAEIGLTLATADNPSTEGAQGWSLSLRNSGIRVDSITTAGTVSAPSTDSPPGLRRGGFEKSEVTRRAGVPTGCSLAVGAVSVVVLSFEGDPVTLPAAGTQVVARLTVSPAEFPFEFPFFDDRRLQAVLEYVEGCQGSEEPVQNLVTWRGRTVRPALGRCALEYTVAQGTESCCDRIDNDGDWLNDAEDPDCAGVQCPLVEGCPNDVHALQLYFEGEGAVESPADGPQDFVSFPGEQELRAVIRSRLEPGRGGIQGYSYSLGVEGDVTLVRATVAGTVAADARRDPAGILNQGFEVTHVVDPNRHGVFGGPQGQGVVGAVVFSLNTPTTLDPVSDNVFLRLFLAGQGGQSGRVFPKNGLQGRGKPTDNAITLRGSTFRYGCVREARVRFVDAPGPAFSRCDPNADGRADIGDAVWIVRELFRNGPATECPPAADCNGDGLHDLTDALAAVRYLFQGGPPPPAPFPSCRFSQETAVCNPGSTACK